jgi:predicted ATPase
MSEANSSERNRVRGEFAKAFIQSVNPDCGSTPLLNRLAARNVGFHERLANAVISGEFSTGMLPPPYSKRHAINV